MMREEVLAKAKDIKHLIDSETEMTEDENKKTPTSFTKNIVKGELSFCRTLITAGKPQNLS